MIVAHLFRLVTVIVVMVIVRMFMRMGDLLMSMLVGVPLRRTLWLET
jgi:hypothetical protein